MTKKINGVLIIEDDLKGNGALCGKFEELRPYGPNGENICFDCGMIDEEIRGKMNKIVICKYCGKPEYYGEMRWLSGKCCCRACYLSDYERLYKRTYEWDDLNGHRPTMEEYENQDKEVK